MCFSFVSQHETFIEKTQQREAARLLGAVKWALSMSRQRCRRGAGLLQTLIATEAAAGTLTNEEDSRRPICDSRLALPLPFISRMESAGHSSPSSGGPWTICQFHNQVMMLGLPSGCMAALSNVRNHVASVALHLLCSALSVSFALSFSSRILHLRYNFSKWPIRKGAIQFAL